MRRTQVWGKLVWVLVVVLSVTGVARAITQGPGGRVYMAGRTTDGDTQYISLYSIAVDANWDLVGGVQVYHGRLVDNVTGYSQGKIRVGCSPEVETFGGDGYGTLVMGAFNNNSPASTMTEETMDVLRIAPSAGGMIAQNIGDGRAGSAAFTGNTESAIGAFVDPEGLYTGGAGNYSIHHTSKTSGNNQADLRSIVTDSDSDTDCTDDDGDYLSTVDTAGETRWYTRANEDQEIYKDRHYRCEYESYGNVRGVKYYNTAGALTGYCTRDLGEPLVFDPYTGDNGLFMPSTGGGGMAVGEVDGHTAVWFCVNDPGPGYTAIACAVDLNDDGNVHNDANGDEWDQGEFFLAFQDHEGFGGGFEPDARDIDDMEWIRMDNGSMFLLLHGDHYSSTVDETMYVIELDDNGDFTKGADGFHEIWRNGSGGSVSYPNFLFPGGDNTEFEFDSNEKVGGVIPEPTTLLLVGTGVIGVIGCIRRKRMR